MLQADIGWGPTPPGAYVGVLIFMPIHVAMRSDDRADPVTGTWPACGAPDRVGRSGGILAAGSIREGSFGSFYDEWFHLSPPRVYVW